MNRYPTLRALAVWSGAVACAGLGWPVSAQAQDRQVYRCPGNVYTDQLSAKEAQRMGCKTLDGLPVTVIQSRRPSSASGSRTAPPPPPRPAATGGAPPAAAVSPAPASGGTRVDAGEQRARDSDARRILESELRKEEEKLGLMRKEFNSGEPERKGDERNFAKYQERVAELKSAIARKEADVAALRRELSKLGGR